MNTVRIEYFGIDPIKVEKAAADFDNVLMDHMESGSRNAMAVVESIWKGLAPVVSGEYRSSITHEVRRTGDNVIGTVFSPLEKADWIEGGTGIHARGPRSLVNRAYIRPHPPRKAMRWNEGGRVIFARKIKGMKPQFVAKRARIAARPEVTAIMRAAAKAAATEMKARL